MTIPFYLLIAFTIGGLVPFTYYGYVYVAKMNKNAPEGYVMPKLEDMWIMVASGIAWSVFD